MSSRLLNHIQVSSLSGIGAASLAKFHKLNIYTVQDLLLHFPFRYENRANTASIGEALPGQYVTLEGNVLTTGITFGRRRMLVSKISDGTGVLTMRFMNFNNGMKNGLAEGVRVKAYGEIKRGKTGPEMFHPQYQVISANIPAPTTAADDNLTPIYPTTDGLTQNVIRKAIKQALLLLQRNPPEELFPDSLATGLMPVREALEILHQPPADMDVSELETGHHPAQIRLVFEELLAYHLSMLAVRSHNQQQQAYSLTPSVDLITQFLQQLPFKPTGAQQRVIQDIKQDMQLNIPMMRLVQGDVGSGKTLVAAMSALFALSNGKQVALMAPTEILAEQHFNNFKRWFEPLGISVDLVSAKLQGKAKQTQLAAIAAGEYQMVIGTHAIFYDKVGFHDLALVIIDEQHRFGVNQRLSLWEKGAHNGNAPHQLIMTATPIPRTLAMTVYADLDVSVIDELPPGRTPIKTAVVSNTRRGEIIERVKEVCLSGRQVYWVCTLVEESEVLDAQAAESITEDLQKILPEIVIGLVHGRMKPDEKQAIMQAFKQGDIQLLVATTVIEVGVDVPNASLMIIENAERLGLSQLHQLRGRVGRGAAASHCVLMYQAPLSKTAQSRLQVMRETNDGFIIAQKDMELRGIGEILGTRQIGAAAFKVVDLARDQHLIAEVQRTSRYLQQTHPEKVQQLIDCWLPDREKYINA
ncbi:ATP-dependent DNA helicase RecG [Zophobihabitans entericus]|uniref:ATP-dependent DNA helicase RecG n=1 Tax=Zophobihabitans entericus TaxID=1635327 RepID=A0A6G9ICH9_9GAMM|nr:ATP-dependent DNA helicase RecG [Zophobihabitans entericus]QIQ21532.1 ATP-dependent DNA helicase RecG [Zophobihabitans entericus]